MRKIKSKERKRAGNIYCDHCKPKKVDAVWRATYNANHKFGDFACDAHKSMIQEPMDNGHRTEADYQTWMRL